MPELPEVEAARRAITASCLGKKITKAVVAVDTKVIEGISNSKFEASLIGKTIVSALRRGKNLWLQLDSPPFPSFQFGMTGAVYIKGVAVTQYKRSAVNSNDEWPSKYSKFFIGLDDGLEMSFTDKRRLAKIRLLNDPLKEPPISELGPDVFLEPLSGDEFHQLFSKKNVAVKSVLLDQSVISGIGNWIADEVLYQARIHPLQVSSSLSKEICKSLIKCIQEVVEYAVEVDADSSRFPPDWLFHFRWGKKPGHVSGKKIEFITVGGRTTAYVPELQKLNGTKPNNSKRNSRTSQTKSGNSEDPDEDLDVNAAVKPAKRELKSRGRVLPLEKSPAKDLEEGLKDGNEKAKNDGKSNSKRIRKNAYTLK